MAGYKSGFGTRCIIIDRGIPREYHEKYLIRLIKECDESVLIYGIWGKEHKVINSKIEN